MATPEKRAFLKVGDVAATLGVSEQTVRLWCRTGILPSYRPQGTRSYLVDEEVFESWIQKAAVRSTLEFLHDPERLNLPDDKAVEVVRAGRSADHGERVASARNPGESSLPA
jgi:excisionase family DNA binding protein